MRQKHNHEFVFTNLGTGRHISNGAMLVFVKKRFPHFKITNHGFRSTFRTWAEEQGKYQHYAIKFSQAQQFARQSGKSLHAVKFARAKKNNYERLGEICCLVNVA